MIGLEVKLRSQGFFLLHSVRCPASRDVPTCDGEGRAQELFLTIVIRHGCFQHRFVKRASLVSERIVRSYELDSFGHVNNAVYLQYCEGARNDYLRQRGIEFADFKRWKIGPVLYHASIDYKRQARADDRLLIKGILSFQGRTRFTIEHEMIRSSDDELVCSALLNFAFVDLTTQKPCRVPQPFRDAFQ